MIVPAFLCAFIQVSERSVSSKGRRGCSTSCFLDFMFLYSSERCFCEQQPNRHVGSALAFATGYVAGGLALVKESFITAHPLCRFAQINLSYANLLDVLPVLFLHLCTVGQGVDGHVLVCLLAKTAFPL